MDSTPLSPVSRFTGPMLGPGMMPMRGIVAPPLSPTGRPFDPMVAQHIPSVEAFLEPPDYPKFEPESNLQTNSAHGFSDQQFVQRITSFPRGDVNLQRGWYQHGGMRHHYHFHQLNHLTGMHGMVKYLTP